MEVDYHELLIKYIALIRYHEGEDYLTYDRIFDFTAEEEFALQAASAVAKLELDKDFNNV